MEKQAYSYWKNLPFLAYYCLFAGAVAFIEPYIPVRLEQVGLTGTQTGLVTSMLAIVALGASISAGYLSDRTGKPRAMLRLSLMLSLLPIAYLWVGTSVAGVIAAVLVFGLVTTPCGDITDRLLMERIAAKREHYGLYRMGGPIGYGLFSVIAGLVVTRWSIGASYPPYLFMMLLCLLSTLGIPDASTAKAPSRGKLSIKPLFKAPAFAYVCLIMALWGFSESGGLSFIALHLTRLGFSSSYTGLVIGFAMAGQMLTFLLGPRLVARLGVKASVALGFATLGVRLAALTFIYVLPLPVVLAFTFVGGAGFALFLPAMTHIIADSFPKELATTAQSLKTLANRGIGGSLGMMAFGLIMDASDTTVAIGVFAASSLLGALLCAVIRRPKTYEESLQA